MPEPGIYGWSTQQGGVHFHRIYEPLRVVARHGVRTGHGKILTDETVRRYDTILVHMLHDERNSEAWEKLAANGRHRLVYDIDDVMWDPEYAPFVAHYTPDVLARLWRNIQLAHVITTPSPVIAEHVARYNANVWVVPNTVPAYTLDLPRRRPAQDRHVLGYQGSHSHQIDLSDGDWPDQMWAFLRDHTDWDLHFWGQHQTVFYPGRTFGHPWESRMHRYYASLQMDIGLGPLKPNAFNRGKSALRAIEYAALGIVPVLTDLEPYRGWVDTGVSGFLIPEGDRWYPVLHELAAQPELMAAMGKEARHRARAWTTEHQAPTWTEAWSSVG